MNYEMTNLAIVQTFMENDKTYINIGYNYEL